MKFCIPKTVHLLVVFLILTGSVVFIQAKDESIESIINDMVEDRLNLVSVYYELDIVLVKFSSSLSKIDPKSYLKSIPQRSSRLIPATEQDFSVNSANLKRKNDNTNYSDKQLVMTEEEKQNIDKSLKFIEDNFSLSRKEKDILDLNYVYETNQYVVVKNTQYLYSNLLEVSKVLSINGNDLKESNVFGQYMYFENESDNLHILSKRKYFFGSGYNIHNPVLYSSLISYFDINNVCYNFSLAKQTETLYYIEATLNSNVCNFNYLYKKIALIVRKSDNMILKTIYYNVYAIPQIVVEAVDISLVNDSVYLGSKFIITDFAKDVRAYVNARDFYLFYNINQTNFNLQKEDLDKIGFTSLY